MQAATPRVNIIVESSRDRWHAYWRTFRVPLNEFSELQKMLAAHFSGDPAVHPLPQVMRLPGFIHHKVKGGVVSPPFRSRIVAINPGPLLGADDIRRMCKPTVTVVRSPNALMEEDAGKGIDLGDEDDDDPVNSAALANLAAWVPELFPNAKLQPGTGAWRVSSKDLGRDLEEKSQGAASCCTTHELGCYAVHLLLNGVWEIIGPDDCPFAPPWRIHAYRSPEGMVATPRRHSVGRIPPTPIRRAKRL